MNPNQINARVVIPISSYDFIMRNHKIDFLFYANNYLKNNQGVKIFNDLDEALNVFRKGVRKAKGTTSEVGLVESYFANPFGQKKKKKETDILLEKYFKHLNENGTVIGELYTMLAIDGFESKGPLNAAKILLDFIQKYEELKK